jgi:hypothetical protein
METQTHKDAYKFVMGNFEGKYCMIVGDTERNMVK